MHLEHFVLCQNSSIDSDTNMMSLFNVVEEITIQSNEAQVPFGLQMILVFFREDTTALLNENISLVVVDPKKSEIFNQKVKIEMKTGTRRSRVRANVTLPLSQSGEYQFTVESDQFGNFNQVRRLFTNYLRQAPTVKNAQNQLN